MKTTRRMRAASLLAVAALGLSACGAVEDLTGGSDETPGQQEEGGAETDGTGSDGDDNDSDDGDDSNDADVDNGGSTSLTAPSTELQVGDTATIPQGKEGGTVTVTVSKITKGSFSDLAHLKDVDEYKDYTPVYVEYTATGTDQSNQLQYRMLEGFYPVLTDGRKAGSLVIFGTQKFEKCDSNSSRRASVRARS